MPLPAPVEREELHFRHIELRGFRRVDGLFDIEARLVDTKTEDIALPGGRTIPTGEPLHEMAIRLVVDESLQVRDVVAVTDASPYGICRSATETLQCLVGLRIGRGWSATVRERLAGPRGCTHLTELLGPLATVALQTFWTVRKNQAEQTDAAGRSVKMDSCFAYAEERTSLRVDLVKDELAQRHRVK
jgi:hypothetical protein